MDSHLNTSHVKVNHADTTPYMYFGRYLNTSHVKVNPSNLKKV